MLGVLQHPRPQFWGPAIGGSGNLFIGLKEARIWHSTRARTSFNAALKYMQVAEYNVAVAESAPQTDTQCVCVIHQHLK